MAIFNGTAASDTYFGTPEPDSIFGDAGNDFLYGFDGNDTVDGGIGDDAVIGYNGDDILRGGDGNDTLGNSFHGEPGNDQLYGDNGSDELYAGTGFDFLNGGEGDDILHGGADDDQIFGDGGNDSLLGEAGNDLLYDSYGNDTLVGGVGNDTYHIGFYGEPTIRDLIVENLNEGTDTVEAYVDYTLDANLENLILKGDTANVGTGNSLNNKIYGNAVYGNLLDGGAGKDTLNGGAGDDTYEVDNPGDVIIETSTGSDDGVWSTSSSYTLSANVEDLTLFSGATSGTGNGLNNFIYAYEDSNTLSGLGGNDTIYGGAGGDILNGGADNDVLMGGDSYPTTNTGYDTLDGGSGSDTMNGQDGNDTYIVDNPFDSVIEQFSSFNAGLDTVNSSISYTLGVNVEYLNLTGINAINGTGNTLTNILTGNTANNSLNGDAGNDILIGGGGSDTLIGGIGYDTLTGGVGADRLTGGTLEDRFVFKSKTEGLDTITDFSVVDDTIDVSKVGFGGGLTAGAAITTAQFRIGTRAGDASDRFIYNKTSGALLFDSDGTGATASVQFAQLSTGLVMTNSDIFVIA